MFRIIIKWNTPIALFQELSGKVLIEDFNGKAFETKGKTLLECEVTVKKGSRGYHNPSGYSSQVFDKFLPIINTMVDSYFQGFLLSQDQYEWVGRSNETVDNQFHIVDF